MMRHYIQYIALSLVLLLGISSCKTRKTYGSFGTEQAISKSDWKVGLAWKGETLSSKMRLEASQGEGLYASLRPFPFVELARFWFLPKQVVVVDMMNKRYAQVNYKDLPKEFGKRLSYNKIESLIFDELKRQTKELASKQKPSKVVKIGKEDNKTIKFSLLKNNLLKSSEDLHIKPKIKDSYQKMDFKEVKFLFKYLLGKVK